MKKLNLTLLLFLSCILFSCQPKREKKQPVIYNNSNQNYKYDDDELVKKKPEKSKVKNEKRNSTK
jgi:hypothetical protein